jgi:hypothetical protein
MMRRTHAPKFTLVPVLPQVEKDLYKTFLQYVFSIFNGFGIAITHSQHCFSKMLIQLSLCLWSIPQAIFYQFIIIHLGGELTIVTTVSLHCWNEKGAAFG